MTVLLKVFTLLGGLAFFLYGMNVMSGGLGKLAGGSLERSLKTMTKNRFAGMALGAKLSGYSNTVYAVMGDGEIQEGLFWEACMYAGAHKLGNLIGIVDSNKIQLDGRVSEVLDTGDLQAKFEAFGFFVQSIDGHDVAAISDAIDRAKAETGRASMIIANTVKGKGVSFMENTCKWHGRVPTDEEFAAAFEELYQRKAELEG